MSTHLLNAGRAAWVSEADPRNTYFDRPALQLDGTGSNEKRGFLWFPNAVSRKGDTVLSATLTLYVSGTWSSNVTITAKRVTASWKHREVKWGGSGSNPSVTAANAASTLVAAGTPGQAIELDVTDILNDVANGGAWYGFRLEIDANGPLKVHSPYASNATRRPTLLVDITSKPDAPDALEPDGEAYAVADSSPVLSWSFDSNDVNAYQAESQVQVSEVEGDYSAPVYDSDWQSNDLTNWDSDLDAAGPMSLDTGYTYYWRVRVRDQNGQTSPWSDEATFQYAVLGDIQIVDPAGEDETVTDSSPTITWYTDDAEQKQIRIRVWESSAGELGNLLYTRQWQSAVQDSLTEGDEGYSGIDTYTIPTTVPNRRGDGDAIIAKPGQYYTVEVAMRDEYARPDADYVYDRREFQFQANAPIDPPTDLVLYPEGTPYVELTWERATEPDFWAIYVDGESVAEIEGSEASLGGTSYSYKYWGALPGVSHLYTVRAKTSTDGFSVGPFEQAATIAPVGIWLCYPALGIAVPILGNDEISQALSETSASFGLLNRRDPVRVVSRVGGYEGSVSGVIAEWQGASAHAHVGSLETLFGKYSTRSLRLVYGAQNMRVNVGNLSISQEPIPGYEQAMFKVSFSYWQTGGFSVEVN